MTHRTRLEGSCLGLCTDVLRWMSDKWISFHDATHSSGCRQAFYQMVKLASLRMGNKIDKDGLATWWTISKTQLSGGRRKPTGEGVQLSVLRASRVDCLKPSLA